MEKDQIDKISSSQGIRIVKKPKQESIDVRSVDTSDTVAVSPAGRRISYRKFALYALGLALIVSAVYMSLPSGTEMPIMTSDEVVIAIEELMDVPRGEVPNVAIVDDLSKVRDQPFYKEAKEGDRVVLYSESRVIVLYRPGENKIIEFSRF